MVCSLWLFVAQTIGNRSRGAALCVFHTATLAHFPPEARARFRELIAELASQRDMFWLSSEGSGNSGLWGLYLTILTAFQDGRSTEYQLAYSHPHGAWLEWLDRGGHA
jgi:hypothetical protein